MKNYWHEAVYVPDVRDPEALVRVARRFLELRDDDLVGGIVVRSFEEYQPGEVRSWWVDGQCVALSAHPDTPEDTPAQDVVVDPFVGAVRELQAPFVTVD
jgi:hypothetical protein